MTDIDQVMTIDRSAVLRRITKMTRGAGVPSVRIVGVDGPSGAGTSMLARLVADQLDAPIVEIDDFVC